MTIGPSEHQVVRQSEAKNITPYCPMTFTLVTQPGVNYSHACSFFLTFDMDCAYSSDCSQSGN